MFVFYNRYSNSKLATVLSMIGGFCYGGALLVLVMSFSDESMTIQETLIALVILLALGFGLNKIAESIAANKNTNVSETSIHTENVKNLVK